MWLDEKTGRPVEPGEAGAVDVPYEYLTGPKEEAQEKDPKDWLPAWFLKKQGHLAAELETVKAQSQKIIRQIEAQQRYLEWRYGRLLEDITADYMLNEGIKKKSVDHLYGTVGWRKTREKVEVVDDSKAIPFLRKEAPEAIKVSERILVSKIPADVQVPGTKRIPAEDKFFWKTK